MSAPLALAESFKLPVLDQKEMTDVLILTAKVVKVTNAAELETANSVARQAKGLSGKIETIRKTLTAPVNAFKKKIDDICNPKSLALDNEARRIAGLITSYTLAENRRVQQEALAQQQKIDALVAEEAQKLKKVKDPVKRWAIQQSTEVAVLAIADPIAPTPAPMGQALIKTPKFEVYDLAWFAETYPHLVKIEVKAGELNAAIRNGMIPMQDNAKIKIWIEQSTALRA